MIAGHPSHLMRSKARRSLAPLAGWSHYCSGWYEPVVIDLGELDMKELRAKEPAIVKPTVMLEPSQVESREEKDLPFSGTVDEVLDYLQLRHRDDSAR